MSIVIDELMKLYAAGVRGGEAELEPLRVQYADYTAWEAEPKREDELAPQLGYWRRTLRGARRSRSTNSRKAAARSTRSRPRSPARRKSREG